MTDEEDALKRIKCLSSAEIACDASSAFGTAIVNFFLDRINNFNILSEIAEERRKNMEWPMSYKENTAFVHSCAASIDIIDFACEEIKKCNSFIKTVIEEEINGERAYNEINEAMNLCIDAINTEIQEKIDFINGLDEDNA